MSMIAFVGSVVPIVLDGFFSYLAQMITSMTRCDIIGWLLTLILRSFAIKTAKISPVIL